jgi:hypothetical protein
MSTRPKVGQIIFLPVDVKPGMFPSEVKFYGNVLGKTISGFAQDTQIAGNKTLTASVINVSRDTATIMLSGEVSQANVLDVPFSFVRQHTRI